MLVDLGCASLACEGVQKYGTAGWKAPEVAGRTGDTAWRLLFLTEEDSSRLDVWAVGVTLLCCVLLRTALVTDVGLQDEATAVLARDLASNDDVHRRSIRFSPSTEARLPRDSHVWKAISGALRLGRERLSMADITGFF